MHTTALTGGVVAHHNGDMSGKIKLEYWGTMEDVSHGRRFLSAPPTRSFREDGEILSAIEVELSFEDIRKLYLAHLRRQMISDLERMSDEQLEEKLREY